MIALLLFTAALLTVANCECPAAADIMPCTCLANDTIVCQGTNITSFTALKGKIVSQHLALHVIHTDVISIEEEFSEAMFRIIRIQNNSRLNHISANAFNKSAGIVNILEISDSPRLNSTVDLFALANNLKVRQEIVFENLGIHEVPDHAFVPNSNVFMVTISDNQRLTRVGKMAFAHLSNISAVVLDDNEINDIAPDGLLTQSKNPEMGVSIIVSGNNLTSKSFDKAWTNVSQDFLFDFDFDDNYIETLPESIFGAVFRSEMVLEISFADNPIKCDCNTKWINGIRNLPEIRDRVMDVVCVENKKNILALNATEFGACS